MLGIGCPDRHALPRITPIKCADRELCSPPASGFVHRPVSPVAVPPGEGLLTERTAGVQPVRRERVFMCRFLDAGKNEALGTLS
jgi:hypothetical protein